MSIVQFVLFRFLKSGIFAWLLYICLQTTFSALDLIRINYNSDEDSDDEDMKDENVEYEEDIEDEDVVKDEEVEDLNVCVY